MLCPLSRRSRRICAHCASLYSVAISLVFIQCSDSPWFYTCVFSCRFGVIVYFTLICGIGVRLFGAHLETAPLAGDAARGTIGGDMGVMALNKFTVSFKLSADDTVPFATCEGTYGVKIGTALGGSLDFETPETKYLEGWVSSSGATFSHSSLMNSIIVKNETYVAKFANLCSVKFVLPDESVMTFGVAPGDMISTINFSSEVTALLTSPPVSSFGNDAIFFGWVCPDGQVLAFTDLKDLIVNTDVTFEASVKKLRTINFMLDENIESAISTFNDVSDGTGFDQLLTDPDEFELLAELPSAEPGIAFCGWLCPDGVIRELDEIQGMNVIGDMNFIAQFSEKITYAFMIQGSQVADYEVAKGRRISKGISDASDLAWLTAPPSPYPDMEFVGWMGTDVGPISNYGYPGIGKPSQIRSLSQILNDIANGSSMKYYARFRSTESTQQTPVWLTFNYPNGFARDWNFIAYPGEKVIDVLGDSKYVPKHDVREVSWKFGGYTCPDSVTRPLDTFMSYRIPLNAQGTVDIKAYLYLEVKPVIH